MPTPWKAATSKRVQDITSARLERPQHAFRAPALPTRLAFTRTAFSLSMARTSVQSGYPRSGMQSLIQGMNSLIRDHVDDGNPIDLRFLASVLRLADAMRSFFSSCIGAGFADLLAQKLGYKFIANSRDVTGLDPGQIGDFLYGGGPAGRDGAVMVEAKGSLRSSFSVGTFQRTVETGYLDQVAPHLGSTFQAPRRRPSTIVHGYAMGCGAAVASANAIGHVVEPAPPRGDIGDHDGAARTRAPRGQAPMTLALANYRGAAILLGLPVLADAIDAALRSGEPQRRPDLELPLKEWRGQQFYLGAEVSALEGDARDALRFAIFRPAMDQLLTSLERPGEYWELDAEPPTDGATADDAGSVAADGLALLPRDEDEAIPIVDLTRAARQAEEQRLVQIVDEVLRRGTARPIPRMRPIRFKKPDPVQ